MAVSYSLQIKTSLIALITLIVSGEIENQTTVDVQKTSKHADKLNSQFAFSSLAKYSCNNDCINPTHLGTGLKSCCKTGIIMLKNKLN